MQNIETIDVSNYVVINSICFWSNMTKLPLSVIDNKLKHISNIKYKILLCHDLHEYTFSMFFENRKKFEKIYKKQ